MSDLFNRPITIRAKRGTEAQITATPAPYQVEGEIAYATDTKQFYVSDGTAFNLVGGGWSGSFTNGDGDTVTVVNGVITDIS